MQAWLALTPEGSDTTNGEFFNLDLPPLDDEYCYLPVFLHEIGTAGSGPNGLIPLTYLEIEAWSRMSKTKINSFEASALRQMSAAYAAITHDKNAPCPMAIYNDPNQANLAAIETWKSL